MGKLRKYSNAEKALILASMVERGFLKRRSAELYEDAGGRWVHERRITDLYVEAFLYSLKPSERRVLEGALEAV